MPDSQLPNRYEGVSNQTFNAVPGIVVAGATYAVMLTIGGWVILALVAWSQANISADTALTAVAVTLIIGIVFTSSLAVVAFLSTIAMTIFNLTLGYAIPALTAGGLIGGMTGFTVAFVTVAAWAFGGPSWPEVVLLILFGPIMATVVCHLGAHYQVRKFQFLLAAEELPPNRLSEQGLGLAIEQFDILRKSSGQHSTESEQAIAIPKVHPLDEPDLPIPEPEPANLNSKSHPDSERSQPRSQWTLRQAFVLTAWFGLLSAIGVAAPEAGSALAVFFASYAVSQLISFGVIFLIWNRIDRRVNRVIVQFFKYQRELEANR